MRRTPLWVLSFSAVFLLTGCVTTLQLSQEKRPAYLSELRAQNVAENPQGTFLEEINHGQVVKGMDRFGVLASWGYPEKRVRSGMMNETWTYVDTDESSGDTVEYTLAFYDGVLKEWDTSRFTTGMTPIARERQSVDVPVTNTETSGKTVPQN